MVSNNRQWDHFNKYLDTLIEQQHRTLEQGDSTILMHRAQGAIAVLRSIKTLRDVVSGS
jgi:hypothetical protein